MQQRIYMEYSAYQVNCLSNNHKFEAPSSHAKIYQIWSKIRFRNFDILTEKS